MVEADIHFRPLHTSIWDIYKVFETLICCLKGIWLRPYTVTLAKFLPDLGIQVHLRSGNDATTSLLRLIFTSDHFSYMHIRHIQSVWAIGTLSQGHMVAPLYRYTGQVGPRFWDLGSLEEWIWCHNVMVEADIHFRLLHTSILVKYKVFDLLVCCLKGIWLHPYTVTLAKMPPDFGIQVHLKSGNDAITSFLRLKSTSDHFIHPH